MSLHYRKQLPHPLDVMVGLAGRQLGAREWPPERGNGGDPGRAARRHVVGGVPDERGCVGRDAESFERGVNGLRIRLVSLTRLEADDDVEETVEPHMREA